ncbi:MAG: glycosyltransferase [Terrimicrobiaceae bacterium]|nr:glycosyltransferase [Terrimicrobiaceae bacterium]
MADPASGGPVASVVQIGTALQKSGHETEVLCLNAPGAAWMADFPLPLHALGPYRGSYGYAKRVLPWLHGHARDFDAIVINGLWQYAGAATHAVATRLGLPYWVYPHGMLDPWFKQRYPLKHLKKCGYWWMKERAILRDAAAVCFTCEDERILARGTFPSYQCNERVVGLGILEPPNAETQREAFHAAFPALRAQSFLLFLSRIHEKKGVDLLLRAYAGQLESKPRNAPALVVAGPPSTPEYLRSLHDLATGLGFEVGDGTRSPSGNSRPQVHFLPMLSGDIKWGAFRACDAFALPSHQENFGIAVVEALACGAPVLISNKVNIWREISRDHAGVIDEDTIEGTGRSLGRWLAMPPEERKQMRMQALACFTQRFHINAAAESLLKVIEKTRPLGVLCK